MRRMLHYVAQNLAILISLGLALAAMITGEYENMQFFIVLAMFAVVLNEVHENRAVLRDHMDRLHKVIEEEVNSIDSEDQQL